MATSTLPSSGLLAALPAVPGQLPVLQLGMIVAALACLAVVAVVVQIVKAMAQATHTMLRTIAPVFVVLAGTGGVVVLAAAVLAGHG
jgi:hypothetical protein